MVSRGIDVSHYQGTVNWPALKKAHGLTWGACKASEGTYYTDASFTSNWSGMKAAGLVRVAYHFARPALPTDASAAAQADRFMAIVKPEPGDVMCLDLEASSLSEAQTNAWARAFGLRLHERAPFIATWLYVGGYAGNHSGADLAPYFDYWWYPRYATTAPVTRWPSSATPHLSGNTTGWPAPHIWQWAESLSTSEGLVDASVSDLPATQLATRNGTTPVEEDVPLTDADIAKVADAVWNRFKIHVAGGSDVGLADALAQILAAARNGGGPATKASGTATVTVNLTPEA